MSNIRGKQLAITKADTVKVDSLSVAAGSLHVSNVAPADYVFFPESSILVWKHKPKQDSVYISYRVLPVSFAKTYFHKKQKFDSSALFMDYHHENVDVKGGKGFVDFNQIDYNGSYGRSISLGNNQDVVLNSHFNLQVNGYLLDSIKLEAALTDNTIPFQPEGNTQRLQEFDQIYIHLSKGRHDLVLGDFALDKPPGYFLSYYKRVQGIFYQTSFKLNHTTTNKVGLSGSVAKGQFARNIFLGLEGNQGPYKLTGNNGEQFFIVLAGTEKVYIDNKLLERGENADYVINYNTAEVRFMPRMMITKDSRIQVEFEYQDKNYLNSLIYAYDEMQVGKKWNIRFNAYSNQDAKNQSYLQNLSGEQKRFLTNIGDSIQNAFYPVITRDTFAPNKILYKIVDTVVNGITYDTVYVYSTNKDSAIYNLSFSYVGEGKGNYIIANSNANGRVYQWIAPFNGRPAGNYEPVVLLITPKMQQVYTLNTTYQIDNFKTLNVEVGASNVDPNLFSKTGNNTHWGLASRLNYTEQRFFGSKDTLGFRKWNVQNNLSYEYVQDKFQGIAPYRNAEFGRDWNVPQSGPKPDEQLVNLSTKLSQVKLGSLQYNFGFYQRGQEYKGYKNIATYSILKKRFRSVITGNVLRSTDTFQNTLYWRPNAYAEYDLTKKNPLTLGARFDAEYNYIRDKKIDTIKATAFAFDRYAVYLNTPVSSPLSVLLNYTLRRDLLPKYNQFSEQSHSHNISLRTGIAKWKNHIINFTGTYRKLEIDDTSFNNQKAEETLLGRLEYTCSLFKNAISLTTLYEFGSGQEQKRAYTYVEVPAGQGVYTWNDYNGDGVQQSNEFEIAIYADQKKFIKVFTPTNEYVKVNYVNFNQSLVFEPGNFWDNKNKSGLQKFISRFSDQASVQISNRLLSSEGIKAYNPFVDALSDSAIIITSSSINNSVYFNRSSAKWGIDYNVLHNAAKQLLTYGVEGNSNTQNLAKLRCGYMIQSLKECESMQLLLIYPQIVFCFSAV